MVKNRLHFTYIIVWLGETSEGLPLAHHVIELAVGMVTDNVETDLEITNRAHNEIVGKLLELLQLLQCDIYLCLHKTEAN